MTIDYEFDPIRCVGTRDILNKSPYSDIWCGKYRCAPIIGDNSYLFKTLIPVDYYDFFKKYIESGDLPLDGRNRGRNLWDLYAIAEEYRNDCVEREDWNNPISNRDVYFFMDNILLHVIVETFNGKAAELQMINYIESFGDGWKCDLVHGRDDSYYGIDIIVRDTNENISLLLQVKPMSFFKGNCLNNKALLADRLFAFDKRDNVFRKYEKEIYYSIYKINHKNGEITWYINEETNNFRFKLTDLINIDGLPNLDLGRCPMAKIR